MAERTETGVQERESEGSPLLSSERPEYTTNCCQGKSNNGLFALCLGIALTAVGVCVLVIGRTMISKSNFCLSRDYNEAISFFVSAIQICVVVLMIVADLKCKRCIAREFFCGNSSAKRDSNTIRGIFLTIFSLVAASASVVALLDYKWCLAEDGVKRHFSNEGETVAYLHSIVRFVFILHSCFYVLFNLAKNSTASVLCRLALAGVVVGNGLMWAEAFLVAESSQGLTVFAWEESCSRANLTADCTGENSHYQHALAYLLPFVSEYCISALSMVALIWNIDRPASKEGQNRGSDAADAETSDSAHRVKRRIPTRGTLGICLLSVVLLFAYMYVLVDEQIAENKSEGHSLSTDSPTPEEFHIAPTNHTSNNTNVEKSTLHIASVEVLANVLSLFTLWFCLSLSTVKARRNTDKETELEETALKGTAIDDYITFGTALSIVWLSITSAVADGVCLGAKQIDCTFNDPSFLGIDLISWVINGTQASFQAYVIIRLRKKRFKANKAMEPLLLFLAFLNLLWWGVNSFYYTTRQSQFGTNLGAFASDGWHFFVHSLFTIAIYYRYHSGMSFLYHFIQLEMSASEDEDNSDSNEKGKSKKQWICCCCPKSWKSSETTKVPPKWYYEAWGGLTFTSQSANAPNDGTHSGGATP
eukprot:m.307428 g.307428  ORF g.307428 m.307428 type:complete len:647 (+) comp42268_c0_seq1:77-2017(+)